MYKQNQWTETTIKRNESYIGDSLEKKIRKVITSKEPIDQTAPLVYTERKDGVMPDYNIRTDKWEAYADAADKISKAQRAKRTKTNELGAKAKEGMEKENIVTGKQIGRAHV